MKLLTQFVILIASLSLICALTDPWFQGYFHMMTLSDWLGLSLTGLRHYYLWQVFTWVLIEPSYGAGITFPFLLTLTFTLYLLWIFAGSFIENLGQKSFIRFFVSTTLFFGILAALLILATGTFTTLMGLTTFLLALFTTWTLMNSENELLLLFVVPIKTKWLLTFLAAGTLLMAVSQGSFLFFLLYPGALIWGYFYGVLFLELWSPFPLLNPLENKLHNWRSRWQKGKTVVEDASQKIKGKVIDLHTGKPHLEDEEFLEAMLDKISKEGEGSLSWNERRRLDDISKRRS